MTIKAMIGRGDDPLQYPHWRLYIRQNYTPEREAALYATPTDVITTPDAQVLRNYHRIVRKHGLRSVEWLLSQIRVNRYG